MQLEYNRLGRMRFWTISAFFVNFPAGKKNVLFLMSLIRENFLSLFGEKSLLFYFPGEKVPPLWPKRGKNFDPTLAYLKIPVDRALLET